MGSGSEARDTAADERMFDPPHARISGERLGGYVHLGGPNSIPPQVLIDYIRDLGVGRALLELVEGFALPTG